MSEAQESENPETQEKEPPSEAEALQDVALKAAEFSEYLGAYLRSKQERVALGMRRTLRSIVYTVLIILCAAGALLTGIAFIFYGMAEGLTSAFGGRQWLAYLISGAVPLFASFLFLRLSVLGSGKSKLKKQWREYEEELNEQRARFGHDAAERASEWASR